MKPREKIEKLIKKMRYEATSEAYNKTLGNFLKEADKHKKQKSVSIQSNIWRIIMKSRITKIATATVIILVVVLLINFLNKAVTPAYALQQTVEASKNLRYLYFEYFSGSEKEPSKKCWIKFDETGQPEKVRVNLYKHWGGSMIAQAWEDGKTLFWIKDQNTLQSFKCEVHTAKIMKLVRECDPKTAISSLYEREQKGDAKIEIEEPDDRKKPILIKATFKPGKYLIENPTLPSFQDVLYVNQATKLVSAIEIYELKNGEYIYNGVWKYPHYDKLVEDEIFNLETEVPTDTMRIVHYTSADVNDQGLEQGAYTEEQVAFMVVQEFFNALIARDYTRVGQLFGGMPTDEAEEDFKNLNVISIISIDKPVKSKKPSGFRVPCVVEIEKNGETIEWQPDGPYVQPVYRHAGRWRIIGGI